ncbi:MAPEG family protein [Jannaschia sp. Os4]|uniref:MAPEG family protein n=1 Tax=Jannaschia sp. Os4 TaxID=2807617 RepID=UPI0019395BF4|nr:MAPEG family protein [Jannaschia sp. Os4]MBM2575117.1 MAPEG family protein [Jannaschia sp. Os4]
MTPELTVLALAVLLHAAQFALMAIPANREVGPGKTMSARDRARLGGNLEDLLSERTARLYRALNNHTEWMVPFTAAVLVVTLSGQSTAFTAACAWTYLAARVVYVPLYAFGARPGRSIAWMVGFTATVAMAISTLI